MRNFWFMHGPMTGAMHYEFNIEDAGNGQLLNVRTFNVQTFNVQIFNVQIFNVQIF